MRSALRWFNWLPRSSPKYFMVRTQEGRAAVRRLWALARSPASRKSWPLRMRVSPARSSATTAASNFWCRPAICLPSASSRRARATNWTLEDDGGEGHDAQGDHG